jgi:sugar lactone lactonase YvrE
MFNVGGRPQFRDLSGLTGKAMKIAEIQDLIQRGNKIQAIKEFREAFGTDLKESKDAVEALERGEGFDISGVQARVASPAALRLERKVMRNVGLAMGGTMFAVVVISGLVVLGVATAILLVALNDGNQAADVGGGGDNDPSLPAKQVTELMRIGGEGTGAGRFKDNRVVAVGGDGRIYSSDYASGRISVFDGDGRFQTQLSVEGGNHVYDLAADRTGKIYLLTNKGIRAIDGSTGAELFTADDSRLRGLAVIPDGRLAAVGAEGIRIYDAQLKLLKDHKNAATEADSRFGFEKVAADASGTLFLIERTSKDIVKFTAEGKYLNRIPTDVRSPNDIALDPEGRIYISDTSSIAAFAPDGRPIVTINAIQAFGIEFNDAGQMFVASRPFVVKWKLLF